MQGHMQPTLPVLLMGDVKSFKTFAVMDNDGNGYSSVTIGTQVWLVENLSATKYNDGTPIPLVTDNTEWSASDYSRILLVQ